MTSGALDQTVLMTGHVIAIVAAAIGFTVRLRAPRSGAVLFALGFVIVWSGSVVWGAAPVWQALLATGRNLTLLLVIYGWFSRDGRPPELPTLRLVFVAVAGSMAVQGAAAMADAALAGTGGVAQMACLLAILGAAGTLFLLHNLYAMASPANRSRLAWSAGLLAAFFAFELNAATVAFLTGSQDLALAAATGFVALAAIGGLVVRSDGAAALPRLYASRSAAFQLASLGLMLIYFLGIAVLWAVADGETSAFLRASQIGLGLVGMALALCWMGSARSRDWLKVLVAKHFFQHRYDYREEWMRFTHALASRGQADDFEARAIRAVAQMTQSRGGLMLRADEDDRLAIAAMWQWPGQPNGEALAWVRTLFRERPVDWIADFAELDPPSDLAQGWAGVPLVHDRGLLGYAILASPTTERRLDWEDFDLLKVASRQIASYLAEQSGQRLLADNHKFDEFNRRMAFVMHDIKNLSSQLSLMVANAERHIDNPDFRADMLVMLRNSSDRLNGMLERLGRYGDRAAGQNMPVDLATLAARVGAACEAVDVRRSPGGPVVVLADPEALEQALMHLVANARDASDPDAPIVVERAHDGLRGTLVVADTGTGMSAQFIRRELFKPFASTKNGGFGIGAHEARTLIRAMGGRMDVDSREGVGTRVTLSLPLASAAAHNERQVA